MKIFPNSIDSDSVNTGTPPIQVGSQSGSNASQVTVTLPQAYADTNYAVLATVECQYADGKVSCEIYNKTASGFTVILSGTIAEAFIVHWLAVRTA